MGRTIITPPGPGDPCSFCFGQGLPFGAVSAPSVITAIFEGIEKGPAWLPGDGEPPNNIYRLPQLSACVYRGNFPGTIVTLGWAGGASSLSILYFGNTAFLNLPVLICQLDFENELAGPFAEFVSGVGTIIF